MKRHRFIGTIAATVLATATAFSSQATAKRVRGRTLACHVAPNANLNYFSQCGPDRPAPSYEASVQVFNRTGTYTYTWSYSLGTRSGCRSSSYFCNVPSGRRAETKQSPAPSPSRREAFPGR